MSAGETRPVPVLAGGTSDNRIDHNLVRDSRDEGVHVGTDSDGNQITDNELRYNKRENLYLLRADGNFVRGNLIPTAPLGGVAATNNSVELAPTPTPKPTRAPAPTPTPTPGS